MVEKKRLRIVLYVFLTDRILLHIELFAICICVVYVHVRYVDCSMLFIYIQLYIHKYRSLTLPPFSKGNNGWEMLWNVLNTKPKISQCVEYWFEKTNRSVQKSIYTTVLMLPLVAFKRSQPCMNGIAILNDRVKKKSAHIFFNGCKAARIQWWCS